MLTRHQQSILSTHLSEEEIAIIRRERARYTPEVFVKDPSIADAAAADEIINYRNVGAAGWLALRKTARNPNLKSHAQAHLRLVSAALANEAVIERITNGEKIHNAAEDIELQLATQAYIESIINL